MKRTIVEAFADTCRRFPNKNAILQMKDRTWQGLTWSQYLNKVQSVAAALKTLHVKPGDKIAIFSGNRFEWAVSDIAGLLLGCVVVPIYQTTRAEDLEFILRDSDTRVLFVETPGMVETWKEVHSRCPGVKHVISYDDSRTKGVLPFRELLQIGDAQIASLQTEFQTLIQDIDPKGLASIVYTSGTTGQPKGALLHHDCIMSEITDVFRVANIRENDRSLSFLPFAHVLGRAEHLGHVHQGFELAYAEGIDQLKQNLIDVKPTFLISVPRIFEKIYSGMIAQAESNPVRLKVFNWAMEIGRKIAKHRIERTSPSLRELVEYQAAKRLVFDKLAQKLGGRLRFAVSGGAPLSRDIAEFFFASGLMILEGYGLTETCAAVTLNTLFDFKFGTVGKPLGEVQIRFAEDGEILVRSTKVFRGYHNRPEATQECLEDGWFKTGDIGEIDTDGFVKITDRKKDLIKTSGGKYIAPQKLENLLKLSKYISNILIHGDQRKYVVTLITLKRPQVVESLKAEGLAVSAEQRLADFSQVQGWIRDHIEKVNSNLASYETIKNFAILENDFAIETGELTPSLKVKRKFCDQKYKNTIDSLYS